MTSGDLRNSSETIGRRSISGIVRINLGNLRCYLHLCCLFNHYVQSNIFEECYLWLNGFCNPFPSVKGGSKVAYLSSTKQS